jgi:hypothetical protein
LICTEDLLPNGISDLDVAMLELILVDSTLDKNGKNDVLYTCVVEYFSGSTVVRTTDGGRLDTSILLDIFCAHDSVTNSLLFVSVFCLSLEWLVNGFMLMVALYVVFSIESTLLIFSAIERIDFEKINVAV